MRNTADVTGGKPIAVLLQSISSVSAVNPLVAFYVIREGKKEVLFFYFFGFIYYPLLLLHIPLKFLLLFKLYAEDNYGTK
jgi:hypothetical protein